MNEFWTVVGANWHKAIVVILVLGHAWKFFFQYIRPAVHPEKLPQPISIVLPPQGCTITVVPLPVIEKLEDD